MKKAQTFQTTDLGLVAFLRCNGFQIIDLTQQGTKTAFILDDRTDRKALVISYFNGAQVSCIDFLNRLQEAKTLMRQM